MIVFAFVFDLYHCILAIVIMYYICISDEQKLRFVDYKRNRLHQCRVAIVNSNLIRLAFLACPQNTTSMFQLWLDVTGLSRY